jgi:ornithine--oxo-acid transaminase
MTLYSNLSTRSREHITQVEQYVAHNYHPLNIVISHGENEWVWDIDGHKYLDMLSAYSAISHGHCHPRMQKTLLEQSQKITLQSRVFYNETLGPWAKKIVELCKMDTVLPMNTGAEAVETAIKAARKWGYTVKGVPRHKAKIIVCEGNFHGRTTTIVSFSSEPQYKDDFGPYDDSFITIPFGDARALADAITPDTVAFLFEPIQGEGGIILPPEGYLSSVSKICKDNNILCIVDEVQTGLARTGKLFAHWYEEKCKPDLMILGKALGGAYYPISAVVGRNSVLQVFQPGDHGSTFGGNPMACALSQTALDILIEENLSERAFDLGEKFRNGLAGLPNRVVHDVRGRGLLNAVELNPNAGSGRFYVELLAQKGILSKDTHQNVLRFAPPLTISDESLTFAVNTIADVFSKTQAEWLHILSNKKNLDTNEIYFYDESR